MFISKIYDARYKDFVHATKDELYKMYHNKNMTLKEIGVIFNVNSATISCWMKEYEIKTHTNSESKSGRSHKINQSKPSKNDLEKMYWVDKMSIPEIADKISVGSSTVFDWMKSYEIESRTISESRIGKLSGKNSPHWKGGISFEPYCKRFNNEFKESVRERDDFICQLCGSRQEFENKKLSIHHIHYDKKNCYPDVVTLCNSCNTKVNFDRDYWEEYFENQLIERGLYCWSISKET